MGLKMRKINNLKSAFFIVLLLGFLTTMANARAGNVVRAMLGDSPCTDEYPNLAAGHIKLTDHNYKQWRKDNQKLHVLGVSDSSCNTCCHSEKILSLLKEKFDDGTFTGKKGKKIQIGRVDDQE